MIDLKKYTKEQRFALVATALADIWFELRQTLSDSEVVEFKNNLLSLNFSKLNLQVTVLRPNGLILNTLSLGYIIDKSLVYEFVPYKRKIFKGITQKKLVLNGCHQNYLKSLLYPSRRVP